jgi:hypothetical protein
MTDTAANMAEVPFGAPLPVSGLPGPSERLQDPDAFADAFSDQEDEEPSDCTACGKTWSRSAMTFAPDALCPECGPFGECHHCRRTVPESALELIGAEFSYCPECAGMSDADKAYEARIARAEDRADEFGWRR